MRKGEAVEKQHVNRRIRPPKPRRRSRTRKPVEKVKSNSHTAKAIKHLKEAIDEGKQGHADVATTLAEVALNHLQQIM
ncbi:MAG TPA: small metal-binding protein SmbP [Methylocella sp.]